MTTLDFALSRTAGRDFEAGDEIADDGARPRRGRRAVGRAGRGQGDASCVSRATDELTVDYDDLERQLGDRTRVVAFALASNATGSLADAKRICALARDAGAISWIDAVHYAAHEPIDVARDRLRRAALLAVQVLRPAPRDRVRAPRARRDWRPYKARPRRAVARSRRARCRTSCSPGSARRSRTSRRSAGWPRSATYERELGERFLAGLPDNVTLYGPPTMEAACRRSSSTSTACRPTPRRTGSPSEVRRLVRRQLVLRRARPAPAGAVAPRRDRALQHRRRGGPAARRARVAPDTAESSHGLVPT